MTSQSRHTPSPQEDSLPAFCPSSVNECACFPTGNHAHPYVTHIWFVHERHKQAFVCVHVHKFCFCAFGCGRVCAQPPSGPPADLDHLTCWIKEGKKNPTL